MDIDIILDNKLSYIESLFLQPNYSKSDIYIALNLVKQSFQMLKESHDGQWIFQRHLNDNSEARYLVDDEQSFHHLIPDRSFIENNIQYFSFFYFH